LVAIDCIHGGSDSDVLDVALGGGSLQLCSKKVPTS